MASSVSGKNAEFKLRCETYGAHHAQRVVAEGYFRVERSPYYTLFQVRESVESVNEFSERIGVDAYGHRVNGEVAARYVVVERAGFHNRIARIAIIGFATGCHEFKIHTLARYLRCSVGAEHVHARPFAEFACHAAGNGYAALRADTDEIHVLRVSLQKNIAYISPDDKAGKTEAVGHTAHSDEWFLFDSFYDHQVSEVRPSGVLVSGFRPSGVTT